MVNRDKKTWENATKIRKKQDQKGKKKENFQFAKTKFVDTSTYPPSETRFNETKRKCIKFDSVARVLIPFNEV